MELPTWMITICSFTNILSVLAMIYVCIDGMGGEVSNVYLCMNIYLFWEAETYIINSRKIYNISFTASITII